jgi:hypothetical protein
MLTQICAWFREGFETVDLVTARELLAQTMGDEGGGPGRPS